MKTKYVKTRDSYGLKRAYGLSYASKVNYGTAKCQEILFKNAKETNGDEVLFYMYNGNICTRLNNILLDFHGNSYRINDDSKVYLIKDCIICYLLELSNNKNTIPNKQKTYLMKDSNGFTKIGKSHNPKIREHTLQSQKPSIELLAVCDKLVEQELHNKYEMKRGRGEWFNLSDKDIEDIITQYNFKML